MMEQEYFQICPGVEKQKLSEEMLEEAELSVQEKWRTEFILRAFKSYVTHYWAYGHKTLSEEQLKEVAVYLAEPGIESKTFWGVSPIYTQMPCSISKIIYEHIGYEREAEKLEERVKSEEKLYGKLTPEKFQYCF